MIFLSEWSVNNWCRLLARQQDVSFGLGKMKGGLKDVNSNTDLNVKVYLGSIMAESSEEGLFRRRKNRCCWCPAERRKIWSV